jgi:hypothetical protein
MDFTVYAVTWLNREKRHTLDFDNEPEAITAMYEIEQLPGVHSVSLSVIPLDADPCPAEVKARIDAVILGRIGLECGRLRLENAALKEQLATAKDYGYTPLSEVAG